MLTIMTVCLYMTCLGIFWWRTRNVETAPETWPASASKAADLEKAAPAPAPATPIFNQMATTSASAHPAARPEWDRLPRVAPPPRMSVPPPPRMSSRTSAPPPPLPRAGPPRITITIPPAHSHSHSVVPRVSLPPLPPHMSWHAPPSPSVYSPAPSPGLYTPPSPAPYSPTAPVTPLTPRARTHGRRATLAGDRMSRLSDLVAQAALVKAANDMASEDSESSSGQSPSQSKRKLVKSIARGHAL
jgi:hypothetical protein